MRSQDLAVGAANLAVLRDRAAGHDAIGEAERAQRPHRVGREQQREPQLPRRGRALEDLDLPARPPQRDRGGQPADPGADDDGVAGHGAATNTTQRSGGGGSSRVSAQMSAISAASSVAGPPGLRYAHVYAPHVLPGSAPGAQENIGDAASMRAAPAASSAHA